MASSPTATTVTRWGVRTPASVAFSDTSASCSTARRRVEYGTSSPTFWSRSRRQARNRRSASRSSCPRALTNSWRPSASRAKYGVEPRASTPARVSDATPRPARASASTSCDLSGRRLGRPTSSSAADPTTAPRAIAAITSSGTSRPVTIRVTAKMATSDQAARRHPRVSQGLARTAAAAAPQIQALLGKAAPATRGSPASARSRRGGRRRSSRPASTPSRTAAASGTATSSTARRYQRRTRATATSTSGAARATSCTSPTRKTACADGTRLTAWSRSASTPTMVFSAPTASARQSRNASAATVRRSRSTGDRSWRAGSCAGSGTAVPSRVRALRGRARPPTLPAARPAGRC